MVGGGAIALLGVVWGDAETLWNILVS